MISVTKAGYIREYEIKLSKSDYKADFKKHSKHGYLQNRMKGIPSQFWFVIHGFELGVDDVPEYAGLIIVEKNKYLNSYDIKIIKSAPRISKEIITETEKYKLFGATYVRYWSLRNKRAHQLELNYKED